MLEKIRNWLLKKLIGGSGIHMSIDRKGLQRLADGNVISIGSYFPIRIGLAADAIEIRPKNYVSFYFVCTECKEIWSVQLWPPVAEVIQDITEMYNSSRKNNGGGYMSPFKICPHCKEKKL